MNSKSKDNYEEQLVIFKKMNDILKYIHLKQCWRLIQKNISLNWNFPTHEKELSYNIMLIPRKELRKFNNSRTKFVLNTMIQGKYPWAKHNDSMKLSYKEEIPRNIPCSWISSRRTRKICS